MRLAIGSDLHLEFRYDDAGNLIPGIPPVPDCDLLIAAGDIAVGDMGIRFLYSTAPSINKVVVPGNHEYYGHDYNELAEYFDKCNWPNTKVLRRGYVEYDDTVIIGATLYSSLSLTGYNPLSDDRVAMSIGDFFATRGWSPLEHRVANREDVIFIDDTLAKFAHKKCVVVTHFVPTPQCIDPKYIGDGLNPYFINDLDWLIDEHKPDAWIFGHTHSSFDKRHTNGHTRLLCNPRGYPGERGEEWSWMTVDI